LRKKRGSALEDIAEPEDGKPSQEAVLMHKQRVAALDAALDTLPDRQREAVVLRHIEGLSNPEIAQVLEIGVEAVESLTARGKRALAQAMADQREILGFKDDTA
jgi:RNA polymerase sigma-70 factor (ECF subfamily)